jgi:hypothetical protein
LLRRVPVEDTVRDHADHVIGQVDGDRRLRRVLDEAEPREHHNVRAPLAAAAAVGLLASDGVIIAQSTQDHDGARPAAPPTSTTSRPSAVSESSTGETGAAGWGCACSTPARPGR